MINSYVCSVSVSDICLCCCRACSALTQTCQASYSLFAPVSHLVILMPVCKLCLLGRMKRKMKRTSSQRGGDGVLRRVLPETGAMVVGDTEVLWFCNQALVTHLVVNVFLLMHPVLVVVDSYNRCSCTNVCFCTFTSLNI